MPQEFDVDEHVCIVPGVQVPEAVVGHELSGGVVAVQALNDIPSALQVCNPEFVILQAFINDEHDIMVLGIQISVLLEATGSLTGFAVVGTVWHDPSSQTTPAEHVKLLGMEMGAPFNTHDACPPLRQVQI